MHGQHRLGIQRKNSAAFLVNFIFHAVRIQLGTTDNR